MSNPNSNNLTVEEAEKILKKFTCLNIQSIPSPEEKSLTQEALLLLTKSSDYQMLGVCANSVKEGLSALTPYLEAIGYNTTILYDSAFQIEGPVYIKFNGKRESYHVDSYTGEYRGVLVSCQSEDGEGINGTYGYLPLDLFS
ncbi:MAG: DUF1824 family protein [Cyanobacteriota bacterium]|nr:DUF1824 family protein [Cyanobacteriota bacterium]